MKYLSLFSGCCGGDLGLQHLLGWECLGYVEWEEYCQKLIAQRITDGFVSKAPIFGDIRTFVDEGYAASYQGMVNAITAGFPCTPFSTAGKQKGSIDERNMWPATIETIRLVRPEIIYLENVPNLANAKYGYFGNILGEISEAGYDIRWTVVSASDVGAPHLRKRLWILANASHNTSVPELSLSNSRSGTSDTGRERSGRKAGTDIGRRGQGADVEKPNGSRARDKSKTPGGKAGTQDVRQGNREIGSVRTNTAGSDRPEFPWSQTRHEEDKRLAKSGICRISHGTPNRVARLKAAGNAQVPAVAATAYRILSGE